jgi:hypothetical protein
MDERVWTWQFREKHSLSPLHWQALYRKRRRLLELKMVIGLTGKICGLIADDLS